ncbi:MAG: hypothetical protein PHI42_06220 [Paludibacteraceae bacterium]|nr:hypothetical protein [Paludibacteraceae bacterium]
MGDTCIMGKDVNAYLDRIDEPGDKGKIEFYAEMLSRQINGNAQVTNAVAVESLLPVGVVNVEEQQSPIVKPVQKYVAQNAEEEYTVTIANQSITMSPTNWMLALIAFILFLILVLK